MIGLLVHVPELTNGPTFPRSRCNPLDLAGLITSLAAMGYTPSQRWLDAFAAAVAARADDTSGPRLAAIAAALRRLGYTSDKPQAWVALG